MKDFLADLWRAYGLWIINAMLLAVGVIGCYLLLPYLIHLNSGAKLFGLAVMAIIAYRYLRKSRSR